MSDLAQYSGYWTPSLIPQAYEPAYATSGANQETIYVYSHNHQFLGTAVWPSGEFQTSNYFNSNWSGQVSSNSSWTYASTSLCGPHGHLHTHVVPQIDSQDGHAFYLTPGYADNANRNFGSLTSQSTGVWVNKTKRDNLCFLYANNPSDYSAHLTRMAIGSMGRGAFYNPITSTLAFTGYGSGAANGYTTARSYGLVGYNETTKMFVTIGNAGSSTATMYVYKNIEPPTLANTNDGTYWDQFDHGSKITVTFSVPPANDTHDYQHYKIFPLDNGNIALVWKQAGTAIYYYRFTGNDGVNSTSWTFASVASLGTSTSYHDSQFTYFDYLPAQVSYDGRYVMVYTQYYYYGAGSIGYAIRVSDGSYRNINWQDTGPNGSWAPISENSFIYGYGQNSDGGQGQAVYQYNLDYLFARYTTEGQDITSYYLGTYCNTPYTSTNYGMIWPVISPIGQFIRGIF